MTDFKASFWAWYDKHVSAGWYKAISLYIGMLAALFPYLLNILDALLSSWPDVAGILKLSPGTTMVLQIFLATVVLPAARAWQQKSVREATLNQAVKTGEVTTDVGTDEVQVNVAVKP